MITVTPEYLAAQGLSPTFPTRFWAKVDKNGPVPHHRPELGPCWLWTGCKANYRYGNIAALYQRGTYRTSMIRAHVASWILHFGAVPPGKEICHFCDEPLCVRPDHLWPGTHEENMADCKLKGRARGVPGERHGMAKLTDEQVRQIRSAYSPTAKNGELLARAFGVTRQQIWHIVHGHQR